MLQFKKKDSILELVENAIEDCADSMLKEDNDTDEYAKMNDQLMKLIEMRTKIKYSKKISPEVWAGIIANLLGILLILNYERVNVIATKALGFVTKSRIQ